MHGHDMGEGMKHSEDVLRRSREARQRPATSRQDEAGRLGFAAAVTAIVLVAALVLLLLSLVD